MRLQSLVEIMRAHASVCNGQHNQYEGDDSEKRQRSSRWAVVVFLRRSVHPDHFEKKIRHAPEVEKLSQKSVQPRTGTVGWLIECGL